MSVEQVAVENPGDFATWVKQIKTSFNYCPSGSGQNSVILVVCDVPE